jgi:hypothetical protein
VSTGGGTTSSNTIQKSDPWVGAQPYLTDLMQQAQNTYLNSQGQTQLPNTYAGQGPLTQTALGLTAQRAMNGSPLINTADSSLANLLQPKTAPGQDALQGLLSGYANPGNAYAQAAAAPNAATLGAQSILGQQAMSGPNPYLDQMFSAESKPIIDAVNAQAGLAGRTGSGASQQLLTRNLGDLASQVYGNNYLQEQQLQQGAANALGNLGQNQSQNLLSAGNALSANAANQANVIGSAAQGLNNQFNTQNQQVIQGATVAPNLAGQDYTDLQNLLNVGGAQDQDTQAKLNSILQQYQYSQQQPWNILSGYAGAISGLGGLGGSSSGSASTTQPSQSMVPSLIGTGLSILPFLP